MATAALWRLTRRLARPRSGLSWLIPTLAFSVALAFIFVVLVRTELSTADEQEYQFGGNDTSVYFNEYVPLSESSNTLPDAMAKVSTLSQSTACAEINSIIQTDARNNDFYAYREFQQDCSPELWGYHLREGAWANSPGEVVASISTGLDIGTTLTGVAPGELTVVGLADNRHATRGSALIAATGTWRSWDWPAASALFPRLNATAIAYTTTAGSTALAEYFREKSAETGLEVRVVALGSAGETLVDRLPFLYLDTALPIALLAAALSLTLRARFSRQRRRLLEAQGVSPRTSVLIVRISEALVLFPSAALGVGGGWLLGSASRPLIAWIAGHQPSPTPWIGDPLGRALLGALIACIGVTVASLASLRPLRASRRLSAMWKPLRRSLAAVTAGGAAITTLAVTNTPTVFVALALSMLAFALVSPDLVALLSRAPAFKSPSSRVALRRFASHKTGSAIAITAAALTVGPVIAMATLLASDIGFQNDEARQPPREGQVIYYLSGDEALDSRVSELALSVGGEDAREVVLSTPQTADGGGVVAKAEGLGAVDAVSTSDDLESLLGQTLTNNSRQILDAGGILWNADNSGSSLWTIGVPDQREITLTGFDTEKLEERWGRYASGYVLTTTLESHDLVSSPYMLVFDGFDQSESRLVGDRLAEQGFDSSLVRIFRPNDPYAVTPFQIGLIAAVGILGLVMIASIARANVLSLRRQSPGLLAIGVPRAWLGSVFLQQTGTTLGIGVLFGALIAGLVTYVGQIQFELPIVIPAIPILVYLAFLAFALTLLGALGVSRIRK